MVVAIALSMSGRGIRSAGPATLIAATTSPAWFQTGAAMQRTPSSCSCSSSA
jgi:hypothetical protein